MAELSHSPGCATHSLAELHPDEEKPAHLSDYSWNEVRIAACVEGCPVLQQSLDRGVELAERFGW